MIEDLIAEATEYEFKIALERKKPKSWLKSVSAFANGSGGSIFFGINEDQQAVGLLDAQQDAEEISRLIKERIEPCPGFLLTPSREEGKDILILRVSPGNNTPYYYRSDGVIETYIRVGNQTIPAPHNALNSLILKGMNVNYESLSSIYPLKEHRFSNLSDRYRSWTGRTLDEEKFISSFNLIDTFGMLTNAGALLADNSPMRQSRLFATRWNGLDKAGGLVDALDSKEYTGSLINLFEEGMGFFNRNTKRAWRKAPSTRIELPEYPERAVFESLVNALIHRDYAELGSEVHLDIFDDRICIYSPGGMMDGSMVQDVDILKIPSKRRNPVLADVFSILGYMERQGSGFKKIKDAYKAAYNYREEIEPEFYSSPSSFEITLYNLNYGRPEFNSKDFAYEDLPRKLENNRINQALEEILIGLIRSNPKVSLNELAKLSGKSLSSIARALNMSNKIKHVGPKKGGHWEITGDS